MAVFNPPSGNDDVMIGINGIIKTIVLTLDSTDGSPIKFEVINYYPNNMNVKIESFSLTNCTISLEVFQAQTSVNKTYNFDVIVTFTGNKTGVYNWEFTQRGNILFQYQPIWRDLEIQTEKEVLNYSITKSGELIYTGRSIILPDADINNINLNRLCADYIGQKLPNGIAEGNYELENYANEFIVTDLDDDTIIEKYTFRDDWSYKTNNSYFLNNPIRYSYDINGIKHIVADKRQMLPISIYRLSGSNSKINNVVIPTSTEYQSLRIIDLSKYDGDSVYATNTRMIGEREDTLIADIKETNYNYCLYYKNSFGGYDYYLIDGNVTKNDNISANYYNNYANNTKQEFEKKKYINRITNNYTLYTDYFTEDEQERFEDLITSTEVYLHNFKNNEILPVNVTNTSFSHKTFTNNGKKLWYNIINLEVAREFYRK